eukprot:scaffold255044_cov17-Tisochrysis_lutea.AAC.1
MRPVHTRGLRDYMSVSCAIRWLEEGLKFSRLGPKLSFKPSPTATIQPPPAPLTVKELIT